MSPKRASRSRRTTATRPQEPAPDLFEGASQDNPAPGQTDNPAVSTSAPSSASSHKSEELFRGKRVFVVDAHSLIHQLFHALPEMTSPDGRPVNAVFGFVRDMIHLLTKYRPDFLICAFDAKEPSFRKEIYAEYKAHRPELDADIIPQIELIEQFLEALGIPVIRRPGFEADDIMATLAAIVESQGGECVLVTNDKDCRQLITDRVKLLNLRKETYMDREALFREWGITPEQVVDFQALVGDSSDNVPGVPLIGPKAAQELLQRYGTLEGIYEHLGDLSPGKKRDNLEAYREQAFLSRELVHLRRDVPLDLQPQELALKPVQIDRAIELCRQLGFRRLIADLQKLAPQQEAVPPSQTVSYRYHVVQSIRDLKDLADRLAQANAMSLDTETTDIRPRWADLVGISLAVNPHEGFYIPVLTPEGSPALSRKDVLAHLGPILSNKEIAKIGQNLKYDLVVLRSCGFDVQGLGFDCMLADYLLDPGSRSHSLDEQAARLLGHETIKISELIGTGRKQKQMSEVALDDIARYAVQDAILPWHLRKKLQPQLEREELAKLFAEVEMPLVEILAEMEYHGIRVDTERLRKLGEEFERQMQILEEEIYQLAGERFNIGSPKQLQEILFDKLQLPSSKKTKTGISTDSEVLEELAAIHPLPAKIIDYRQYAKLKSTYVDGLATMVCPRTGRVHASFHQAVTATGRLSCSDPNLQNIPVRTEEGRGIRSAFVAEEGWRLISADYSQIELRMLAHFSQDERLCEAFHRDEDIHTAVAAEVFGVPPNQVTPEMRRKAKAVNFGVIYGQTPFGLAKQLRISKEEAASFIEAYFARYPGIDRFLLSVLQECRRQGYVRTILGRKRRISGVRENPTRQRNLPERTAINTVVQGSAADLIKLAMIRVRNALRAAGLAARMILQVHDELVFECPAHEVSATARIVRQEMESVMKLNVPLKVDVGVGPNWNDMEPA
ncbi:DNA polymerase I [Thermogutta sp.]|uniref:DNA polymerase I n=1 Tax=Thermogutta sp. TaxID=1962930 RepID=UPI003C7E7C6A